ncbi:MAG: hypothetical protein OEU26_03480 [Candidatus Tectomicrobia bacterium]|nr:hypothetical protein [Candidatus Tectomicrobia bacterium]
MLAPVPSPRVSRQPGDEGRLPPGPDKGYSSGANRKAPEGVEGLDAFCLQQPGVALKHLSEDEAESHA